MISVFDPNVWKRHLENDIMPFWRSPGLLGEPLGNFPTYADLNGVPVPGKPHYMRMQGRQIYVYLEAASILECPAYLKYAEAGFRWLETHARNPHGGYYPLLSPEGKPIKSAITIQDLCYIVFPYMHLYRRTGNTDNLKPVLEVIRLILDKYLCEGRMYDAMDEEYTRRCEFEGDSLNVVSVLDFMNLLLIPLLKLENVNDVFPEGIDVLERMLDLLVGGFWSEGIFWNDSRNRTDYTAKHVDMGHTSKAYGIVWDANRILAEKGLDVKYHDLEGYYMPMLQAASDAEIGWKTDFRSSSCTFSEGAVQWWRYILINQVAARYALVYEEVLPLLKNGLEHWFSMPFVDSSREVRGIREGLRKDGTIWEDDDSFTSKANLWKNGYHEVEHVASMLQFIEKIRV